jgi:hypothetical protein
MTRIEKTRLDIIKGQLEDVSAKLRVLADEHQEQFEEHSQAWQEGDKGEDAQNIIDALETACSSVEEALYQVEGLI